MDYGISQLAVPVNPQDQVAQSDAPSYHLPIDTGDDVRYTQLARLQRMLKTTY